MVWLDRSEAANQLLLSDFMELLVLPAIKDENERKRTMDELPQSGTGKIVMTTEPKFIPKEAAELPMEDMKIKIRLIDCVGFMIPGAGGKSGERTGTPCKKPLGLIMKFHLQKQQNTVREK